MPTSSRRRRWGVILAGGNGERLRPLTRVVTGDDRPKQFCPLLEHGQTLLDITRKRIRWAIAPARTVFVVTRQHEAFYSPELSDVYASRIVAQPINRGTLAAVLASLAVIRRHSKDATVAFFPSDHYYSRERSFLRGVQTALAAAESFRDAVILVGAKALSPEPAYGYIQPAGELRAPGSGKLRGVGRFWEKPSAALAQALLQQGCLWNTFVMAGRVEAFLNLVSSAAPEISRAFEPLLSPAEPFERSLHEIYDRVPDGDFSRLVLSSDLERVAVLDVGDIGWSDLGDPHRLIATLSEHGIPSPWRQLWLREMGIAAVAG